MRRGAAGSLLGLKRRSVLAGQLGKFVRVFVGQDPTAAGMAVDPIWSWSWCDVNVVRYGNNVMTTVLVKTPLCNLPQSDRKKAALTKQYGTCFFQLECVSGPISGVSMTRKNLP